MEDLTPSIVFPHEAWIRLDQAVQSIRVLVAKLKDPNLINTSDIDAMWRCMCVIQEVREGCQFIRKVLGHDTFDQDAAIFSAKVATLQLYLQEGSEDIPRVVKGIRTQLLFIAYLVSSLIFWQMEKEKYRLKKLL